MIFFGWVFLLRHAFIDEGVARRNAFHYSLDPPAIRKWDLLAVNNITGKAAFCSQSNYLV